MKTFQRQTTSARFKGAVTEEVVVPDTIGVHEDGVSIEAHGFEMYLADGSSPKPNEPFVTFPVNVGSDTEKVEGYLSDLLPDAAEQAQFLALLTKMRDNGLTSGSLGGRSPKDAFTQV